MKVKSDGERKKMVHLLCMEGEIDPIVELTNSRKSKEKVIRRALDILVGLSLKGYEGKSVGAIFLIGDIEGIRRNTSQMIINPFKGWRDVNIQDPDQQATIEAFTQLDGAMVIDTRGFVHYAGRMINVKGYDRSDHDDFQRMKGKGSGTRWRASRYITLHTRTVALTLSSSGNITAFFRGKDIGGLTKRLCSIDPDELSLKLLMPKEELGNERV